MRVAIFTEEDYTFMFEPYTRLIAALKEKGHELVGIYLFPARLGKYSGVKIPMYYLKTFGLGVFLRLAFSATFKRLQQFIYSLGSGAPFTYRTLGKKFGAPVLFGKNPNQIEVVEWVKKNNIDVILISFGHIVGRPLISAVGTAILNKHSALLPAYRGLFPVFWTLFHGLIPVGLTIHKVSEAIDAGEILYQKSYEGIGLRSVFGYYKRIYNDLVESTLVALEILEGKKNKQLHNEGKQASYFSLPKRKDHRDFLKRGYKFI